MPARLFVNGQVSLCSASIFMISDLQTAFIARYADHSRDCALSAVNRQIVYIKYVSVLGASQ